MVHTRLESNRLALSAAFAAGVAYAVCAAAVAIVPDATMRLFGWLTHVLNLEQFAMGVSPGAFVLGLVEVLVYTYLVVLLFAATYNAIGRMSDRRETAGARPMMRF